MHERAGKVPFQTQRCPGLFRSSASGAGIERPPTARESYPMDRTRAPGLRWQRFLVALTAGSS